MSDHEGRCSRSEASYSMLLLEENVLLRAEVQALRMQLASPDFRETCPREAALEQAAREKDEFLAMLGHELRKPLGAIGAAVALQQTIPIHEPRIARARDVIARQSAHMARMVEDIFDLARIARGRMQLRSDLHDVVSLVHSLIDDFRAIITSRSLELELEAPQKPLWVMADATRISQVLANLLDNAAKFTMAPGHIHVRIYPQPVSDPDFVVISVRDTGIGMDPDSAKRVFELFRQCDQSSEHRDGLGVGLALVKGLIELHGGDVAAHSDGLGLGSEIVVRLPACRQPQELKAPLRSHLARPG